MAEPAIIVITSEIVLDTGRLPDGVTVADIANEIRKDLWSVTIPNLGVSATRSRSQMPEGHVHVSTSDRNCQSCMNTAMNERNPTSV